MKINDRARSVFAGFTLIELLVVIAILAILAGFLFPVFFTAREKGRQVTCLSNQRQVSYALMMYTGDADEVFPWAFCFETNISWDTMILPYLKNQQVFACPSDTSRKQACNTNPQVIGLFAQSKTDETPVSLARWFPTVTALSAVETPTTTILLGDAIVNYSPGGRSSAEFAFPHPANIADHTRDFAYNLDWPDSIYLANNKQISWRHSGGANFVFVDGHVKWRKRSQLRDENWDVRCHPGQGCDNGGDYPKADGTCPPNGGDQSPINCK